MKILVVDASPLIYATYNSVGHLKKSTGEFTGLRFGFIRSINAWRKQTQVDRVAICYDMRGPVLKAADVPTYKSNRKMTAEKIDMYSQVPDLMDLLKNTSWWQLRQTGFEADDVIAGLCRIQERKGNTCFIVSPDQDLWQLVDDDIFIYQPKNAKKKMEAQYLGSKEVQEKLGYAPVWHLAMKALYGDPSDNVPGSLMRKGTTPKQLAMIFEASMNTASVPTFSQLKGAGISCDEAQYELNVKVLQLYTPDSFEALKGTGDAAALRRDFIDLEFKSLIPKIDEYVV